VSASLTTGGGGSSRPLVADTTNLGAADIALLEIIEDKMSFEMPEIIELTRPTARGRKTLRAGKGVHAKRLKVSPKLQTKWKVRLSK